MLAEEHDPFFDYQIQILNAGSVTISGLSLAYDSSWRRDDFLSDRHGGRSVTFVADGHVETFLQGEGSQLIHADAGFAPGFGWNE